MTILCLIYLFIFFWGGCRCWFCCCCCYLLIIDCGRQNLLKMDWFSFVLIWLQFLSGTGCSNVLTHVWCNWCGIIKVLSANRKLYHQIMVCIIKLGV